MNFVNRLRTKYLDDQMIDDEHPLYRTHISWIPVLTHEFPYWIIGGAVGGIAWGITDNFLIGLAGFLISVLLGFFLQIRLIMRVLSIDIVVTNKFVRYKEGIITIDESPSKPLQRIDSTDVDLDKNIWQRILKYGDFTLNSISGEDSLYIKDVARPRSLKRCIDIACNKYVYERGMNPPGGYGYGVPGGYGAPGGYGGAPGGYGYQGAPNGGGYAQHQPMGQPPHGAAPNGGYFGGYQPGGRRNDDWTRPGSAY